MTRPAAAVFVAVLGAGLAAQQPSPPTFTSGVNAVTLDVRVVDDHGQFVADLSKDDLQVFEDGAEQTLTAFNLVNIPVRADTRPSDGATPIDADSATNDITAGQRLYVLVLDDLRSEPTRSAAIKAQARDFIEHRFAESDRAVVLTTSGRRGLVQEFTNNRKRLLDAIDKFEAGFDARVKCGDNPQLCACNDDRTAYQSLSGVAQWLVPVKGQRKSLLFFGQGDVAGGRASDPPAEIVDPLGPGDAGLAAWKQNDPAVAGACQAIGSDRKEAADFAARANLTVYPVDPRRNADAEFARIVDDTSAYYLVGYVPTNEKRDGTFRKIEVRAKRPGLTATTRSGYLAPTDAPRKKAVSGSNAALTELMASPVATSGLTMAVSAPVFRGGKGKASVEVIVDVAGTDLAAASSGARGVGKLELLEAVADADGHVKASERGSLDMKLSDATRQAMADQGLRVMSRLDVPPGKYLLRVAGVDGSGSSKGSVQYDLDVPDFSSAPIAMSGLTLSLASEARQPTTGSDKDWPKRFDHAPTARRTFRAGDELTVAGEAYINEKWNGPIQANTMILRPSGDVAIETRDTLGAGGPSTYRYDSTVALTNLEPGDYIFKVEVQTGDFTASRQIPFSVAPGLAGVTYTTDPSLRDVLRRAANYVADFSGKVRGLVAEETYQQDAGGNQRRELESDFLLVQLPGWAHPVEFRDVFEVDGVPVRDREERLTRLFLTPSQQRQTQIEAIVKESARYNIGRVARTMNTPMLPLQFLGAFVQKGFDFRRTTDTKPMRVSKAETESGPFAVPDNVWVIEYRETSKETVIRNQQGRNVFSYGRFWIDPVSGRVLMSELRAEGGGVSVVVDVSYRWDESLGVAVPVEMRESYDPIQPGPSVRGVATYGHFRRFSVQTDEAVAPPK